MPKGTRIHKELPPVGTELHGKFKDKKFKAIVVADNKNKTLKYIRFNGVNYTSMTAAAIAITKQSVNGWRFWKFELK